jgi:hypothetical protein
VGAAGYRDGCCRDYADSILYTVLCHCYPSHAGDTNNLDNNDSHCNVCITAHGYTDPDGDLAPDRYIDPYLDRDITADGYRNSQPAAIPAADRNRHASTGVAVKKIIRKGNPDD